MPSFNDALDNLVSVLQNRQALIDLCQTNWGRSALIKRMFKFRTELGSSEFPIILVTRAAVALTSTESRHTVRLYCGFLQDDRELAQQQSIDYSEAICAAINENKTLNKSVLFASPIDVTHDEGINHPAYFCVITVTMIVAES